VSLVDRRNVSLLLRTVLTVRVRELADLRAEPAPSSGGNADSSCPRQRACGNVAFAGTTGASVTRAPVGT